MRCGLSGSTMTSFSANLGFFLKSAPRLCFAGDQFCLTGFFVFGFFFLRGFFRGLLLFPVRLALNIDFFDGVCQMDRVFGIDAPGVQQHFQVSRSGLPCSPSLGKNVMVGRQAFEKDCLHIVGAAVMRNFEKVDVPCLSGLPGAWQAQVTPISCRHVRRRSAACSCQPFQPTRQCWRDWAPTCRQTPPTSLPGFSFFLPFALAAILSCASCSAFNSGCIGPRHRYLEAAIERDRLRVLGREDQFAVEFVVQLPLAPRRGAPLQHLPVVAQLAPLRNAGQYIHELVRLLLVSFFARLDSIEIRLARKCRPRMTRARSRTTIPQAS